MRKLLVVLVLLLSISLVGCKGEEEELDLSELSKVAQRYTSYAETKYSIKDYTVYYKDNLGDCDGYTEVTYYVNSKSTYEYNMYGACTEDPLFYIKDNDIYYTLNEAVKYGYFKDNDVMVEFIIPLMTH